MEQEHKRKKSIFKRWWFWVLLVLILLVVVALFIFGSSGRTKPSSKYTNMSLEDVKSNAIENLEYNELFRNINQYVGKVVHYKGKVNQVLDDSNDTYQMRLYVTEDGDGYWNDDVLLSYKGSRVLEDDVVEFWGEIKGIKKYETVLGASRSIPEIAVVSLNVLKDYKQGGVEVIKKTAKYNETVLQSGFTIILDKIELTDKNTKVWLTIKNKSKYKIGFYTSSALLVQDSKQYETEYVDDEEHALPDEFMTDVEAQGYIAFPIIKEMGKVKLVIKSPYAPDISYDDYDKVKFEDVVFEVEF